MDDRSKLLIVPNDKLISLGVLESDVFSNRDYEIFLADFYTKSNYSFDLTEFDKKKEFIKLAALDNLVIQTSEVNSKCFCFIPMNVSDFQYKFLYDNSFVFSNYKNMEGYYLKEENGEIITCMTDDINQLILIANKKNSELDERDEKIRC